jgi:hypothetical protein
MSNIAESKQFRGNRAIQLAVSTHFGRKSESLSDWHTRYDRYTKRDVYGRLAARWRQRGSKLRDVADRVASKDGFMGRRKGLLYLAVFGAIGCGAGLRASLCLGACCCGGPSTDRLGVQKLRRRF